MTENIGPVQMLAIGFDPDARFEGRIMDELENLERHETIRILDLLFVGKDAETGDLLALDYQGEELGAIVGALLGFDFEGEQPSETVGDRGSRLRTLTKGDSGHCGLAAPWQLRRLPPYRARVGARSKACDPRCGWLSARGGFPHARGHRRSRYRARRHVRGYSRNSRPKRRAPGRREMIKQAEPTERKES